MGIAEEARQLLSMHGSVRCQPRSDWTGAFPLPGTAERFYREIGPVDVSIPSYGNSFFLPSLAELWQFQAGYRWNGLTGESIADWQDDWLVIGDQGGDPFILSRSSGVVLHDEHGRGVWEPGELFPDLHTMAACLGQLGAIVTAAGEGFTDKECRIREECREVALASVQKLLGSSWSAECVLASLGWG